MGAVTDLLGSLGSAYITSRYQQTPVAYPSLNGTGSVLPAGLGIPFVDVIPEPPAAATCDNYVYNPRANCGAGKWQKRSRRRRKRLASKGDLADLAALKGVLGQGKAFEVWIATHGR